MQLAEPQAALKGAVAILRATQPHELVGTCELCEKGKYAEAEGLQGNCLDCPAGKYCPEGARESMPCPIGSYCPKGAAVPTACPEHAESSPDYTSCWCKHGYFGEKDEDEEFKDLVCRRCPEGIACGESEERVWPDIRVSYGYWQDLSWVVSPVALMQAGTVRCIGAATDASLCLGTLTNSTQSNRTTDARLALAASEEEWTLCAAGQAGAKCEACDESGAARYIKLNSGRCKLCGPQAGAGALALLMLLLVALLVSPFLCICYARRQRVAYQKQQQQQQLGTNSSPGIMAKWDKKLLSGGLSGVFFVMLGETEKLKIMVCGALALCDAMPACSPPARACVLLLPLAVPLAVPLAARVVPSLSAGVPLSPSSPMRVCLPPAASR